MWVDVTSEKREGNCVSEDRDIAEPGGKIVIWKTSSIIMCEAKVPLKKKYTCKHGNRTNKKLTRTSTMKKSYYVLSHGTVFSKKTPNDDGHISTVNKHLSSLWSERGRVGFPHIAGAQKHLKPTPLPVSVGGSCICTEGQQSLLHYSSNWREQHGVYRAINIQLAHYLPVKRQTDDSAVLQQSFSGREATSTRSLTPKCSRIPVHFKQNWCVCML